MIEKTTKPALSPNGSRFALRARQTSESWMRRTLHHFVSVFFATMLIASVLHLSGCQTTAPVICPEPPNRTLPALSEPLPSVSYSLQAQTAIESWRKKLEDTPTTSKP